MPLPEWKPTRVVPPSSSHKGEATPEIIYTEVGRALHAWEHAESAMTRLFQVLCESRSIAPCRAYGVIESPFTKVQLLRQAAETFFGRRDLLKDNDYKDTLDLFRAYEQLFQYRNNIAHGMTIGHHLDDGTHSGYFLSPPSYAAKKVRRHKTTEVYLIGASYFYKEVDILHYTRRFEAISDEVYRITHSLNDRHGVIPRAELHP